MAFMKNARLKSSRSGKVVYAAVALAAATLATLGAQTKKTPPPAASRKPFTVVEATIPEMRIAMEQGRVTSRELVRQYLIRIATYEDRLHAAITVNPDALTIAAERDRERAQGTIRGPLHGIPVALKDNIHTTDMRTTGGALAFEYLMPPYEATITKNLKDAGAIVLAKTTLTELANWVAGARTPMPGNYNAVAGQGFNPYDPRKDPREATFDGRAALNTGGSSSGAGTAANFWAANVGTETSGSILSPANQSMLAGIKPTVGRISRYGVIPITADQDTAGPMAKTVSDVAIMFGALESASPDPNDPATRKCAPAPGRDYTKFLNRDGLKGARIGIPRTFYFDRITPPGETTARGGLNDDQKKAMDEAIAVLKAQGAIIIDPADIPSVVDKEAKSNFLQWGQCSGVNEGRGKDENCSVDLKYGMKRDFNKWLASLGAAAPFKTLGDLRAFNTAHQKAGAIKYGPWRRRRGARGARRVSDGHRAVRHGAERAESFVSEGLQREAVALRRQLHGHGVQRAEADRARIRVRAGDEEAPRAAAVSVATQDVTVEPAFSAVKRAISSIEKFHRVGTVLREQISQRTARFVLEPIEQCRVADAIEAEIPEGNAHLAPRRERPRASPEEHAERPHRPLGRIAALARVAKVDSPLRSQPLARDCEAVCRSRAPDDVRHEQARVGQQRLELLRQHGRHFAENRLAGARERRIAELADDPRAEHERLNLFTIEHKRRQIVPGPDAIPDAGFAVDRRAGEDQIADVAIDRPLRDLQLPRDLLRRRHGSAAAKQLDDLEQTVGSAHAPIVRRPALRPARSRGPRDPRTRRASRRASPFEASRSFRRATTPCRATP